MAKKDDILVVAKAVFTERGFDKVSVEELCEAAQVSRMTFYRSFANKTDLVAAVLRMIVATEQQDMEAVIAGSASFPEKVTLIYDIKVRHSQEISQPFARHLFSPEHSALATLLHDLHAAKMAVYVDFLKEGQAEGELPAEVNLDMVPEVINAFSQAIFDSDLEGAERLAKVKEYAAYFTRSIGLSTAGRGGINLTEN